DGEREGELAQVMEVVLRDVLLGGQVPAPPYHEEGPRHERGEPSAHVEPPAVHRALEVQIQRHREVPRDDDEEEVEADAEPDRQLPLARVRGVDLSALVPE